MTVEEMILKGIREECVKRYPGRTITNCISVNMIIHAKKPIPTNPGEIDEIWSFCLDDFEIWFDGDREGCCKIQAMSANPYGPTVARSFEIANPEFPENMLQYLDESIYQQSWESEIPRDNRQISNDS